MIEITVIIIGIIFGYILFFLYKKFMVTYHGPNSSIVRKTIYKDEKNNKCYMFEPKVYLCNLF